MAIPIAQYAPDMRILWRNGNTPGPAMLAGVIAGSDDSVPGRQFYCTTRRCWVYPVLVEKLGARNLKWVREGDILGTN